MTERYAKSSAVPARGNFTAGNPINRRAFMKRTGAASVATLVLLDSLGSTTCAQAAACSCVPHNGHCHYITKLEVVYTSKEDPTIPVQPGDPFKMQGKVFRGKMRATVVCCQGQNGAGHSEIIEFDVHSGGYRDLVSAVPDDPTVDSVIPQGTYQPDTSLDAEPIDGFDLPVPNRTEIEIHGPKQQNSGTADDPTTPGDESQTTVHEGRSSGCIIITDTTAGAVHWTKFKKLMNKGSCPHHKANVPLTVTYGPNAQPKLSP